MLRSTEIRDKYGSYYLERSQTGKIGEYQLREARYPDQGTLTGDQGATGIHEEALVEKVHSSISSRLRLSGIGLDSCLSDNTILRQHGCTFAIGDTSLDTHFGWRLLQSSHIQATYDHNILSFPSCIIEQRATIERAPPPSTNNRKKFFVTNWSPPILDLGGKLRLQVAMSDFFMYLAMEASATILHEQIRRGELALDGLARCIALPIVVITADRKLVLTKRSTANVHFDRSAWDISIGETSDPMHDCTPDVAYDPAMTVRRALQEPDELNLPASIATETEIYFAGIATEWRNMGFDLIGVAKLPITFAYVRDYFGRGEADLIDSVDYSLECGLRLIREGMHMKPGVPGSRQPITAYSRVSLLALIICELGLETVVSSI
jgi:hypothetical protein